MVCNHLEPKTVTETLLENFEFHKTKMLLHKRFLLIVRAHDGFKNKAFLLMAFALASKISESTALVISDVYKQF